MVVLSLLVILLGIGLLYWGGRDDLWQTKAGLKALVNNLGGLLIISAGFGLFWELVGKRSFAREVLETARTSTDVEAAGISRIGTNYLKEPNWEALFAGVTKLDIFVAYGRTWRNQHLEKLKKVTQTPGSRLRVYLPDPGDAATLKWLSVRFDMSPSDLFSAIHEARRAYQALPTGAGSTVEVRYRAGEAVFSCYRFDSTAVMTLYTHQRKRTGVPTMVCRAGGSIYQFVREEFTALHEQSSLAPTGAAPPPPVIDLNSQPVPPGTPSPPPTGGTS